MVHMYYKALYPINYLLGRTQNNVMNDIDALESAICNGDINDVERLLKPNFIRYNIYPTEYDNFPIYLAAEYGRKDIVELLIKLGADPTARDNGAIHIAIQNGHSDLAEFLIETTKANDYMTLLLAAKYGELKIVQMMIKAGADRNIPYQVHKTPLHLAIKYDKADIVRELLTRGNCLNDNELLYLAARKGRIKVVKLLLERFLKTNIINEALCIAAENNHIEVVTELLKQNDVKPNIDNNFPIRTAAREGNTKIVKLLLMEPSVTALITDNSSRLHFQAAAGNTKEVQMLINKQNFEQTPQLEAFWLAIINNRFETAKVLMKQMQLQNNFDNLYGSDHLKTIQNIHRKLIKPDIERIEIIINFISKLCSKIKIKNRNISVILSKFQKLKKQTLQLKKYLDGLSSSETYFFLVERHGKTPWDKKMVDKGPQDLYLTEEGIKQAEIAAIAMGELKINTFISSDLQRCIQTADITKYCFENLGKDSYIDQEDCIKERNFGRIAEDSKNKVKLETIFANCKSIKDSGSNWLARDEIAAEFEKLLARFYSTEGKKEFRHRILHGFNTGIHKGGNILFVTSGHVIDNLGHILGLNYLRTSADNNYAKPQFVLMHPSFNLRLPLMDYQEVNKPLIKLFSELENRPKSIQKKRPLNYHIIEQDLLKLLTVADPDPQVQNIQNTAYQLLLDKEGPKHLLQSILLSRKQQQKAATTIQTAFKQYQISKTKKQKHPIPKSQPNYAKTIKVKKEPSIDLSQVEVKLKNRQHILKGVGNIQDDLFGLESTEKVKVMHPPVGMYPL